MTKELDSMYELTETYKQALSLVDDDWVLTDEAIELLHSSELDIVKKSEAIFWVLRNMEAKVKMYTDEKEYLNKRQKSIKNNIEKLRELVKMWLDTIWLQFDKNGKKSQKLTTDKGSCYYTFKENVIYNDDEIDDKYKVTKKEYKLVLSLEELAQKYPELVEVTEKETFDYELLKFDYDRVEWEKPKGIVVEEIKTLTIK